MTWVWALLALLAGAALAVQAGVNAQLRQQLGHPTTAALANTLVAAVTLVATMALLRPSLPDTRAIGGASWWQWTGGVLGGLYLLVIIVLAYRLGAATLLALVISGQVLAAVALDHFGLLGFAHHPVSVPRVAGAALLVVGVVLIRLF
jgi:bacterial/archaeal transporter family-2 protein